MEIYNDPEMRLAYFHDIHYEADENIVDGKMPLLEFRLMWLDNFYRNRKLSAWETGVPEDWNPDEDWRARLFKNSNTHKTKQALHKRLPSHFKGLALAANTEDQFSALDTEDQFSALDTDQSEYLTVEELSHLEGDFMKSLFIGVSCQHSWNTYADLGLEEF